MSTRTSRIPPASAGMWLLRILMSLLAVVFIGLGLHYAYVDGRNFVQGLASKGWEQAPGVIEASTIEESRGNRNVLILTPRIVYRYVIDGRVLRSERIQAIRDIPQDSVHDIHSRFRQGDQVTVYVDRTSGDSVLMPGVPDGTFWQLSGTGIILFGAAMFSMIAHLTWIESSLAWSGEPAAVHVHQALGRPGWEREAGLEPDERERHRRFEEGIEREIAERQAALSRLQAKKSAEPPPAE